LKPNFYGLEIYGLGLEIYGLGLEIYGLGLEIYGLGLEGSGLGSTDIFWHHPQTQEILSFFSYRHNSILIIVYTQLIINEYLNNSNKNLVHYMLPGYHLLSQLLYGHVALALMVETLALRCVKVTSYKFMFYE